MRDRIRSLEQGCQRTVNCRALRSANVASRSCRYSGCGSSYPCDGLAPHLHSIMHDVERMELVSSTVASSTTCKSARSRRVKCSMIASLSCISDVGRSIFRATVSSVIILGSIRPPPEIVYMGELPGVAWIESNYCFQFLCSFMRRLANKEQLCSIKCNDLGWLCHYIKYVSRIQVLAFASIPYGQN